MRRKHFRYRLERRTDEQRHAATQTAPTTAEPERRPVDLSDRFPVGSRVRCKFIDHAAWWPGEVTKSWIYTPRSDTSRPERRIHVKYDDPPHDRVYVHSFPEWNGRVVLESDYLARTSSAPAPAAAPLRRSSRLQGVPAAD
jgi:hypothetical protein